MRPNMQHLLGLTNKPIVFHAQTWPTPVDIPYVPATSKMEGK